MPTIYRLSDTLKICMYAGDHSPPHFHVIDRTTGKAFLIRLDTLQVLRGTYSPRAFAAAVAWAAGNTDMLARKWAELNERD